MRCAIILSKEPKGAYPCGTYNIMKIFTLTLSPAFDIHCRAEALELFRENSVRITERDIGGKGINISRALTLHGVENTAVAVLGRENGAELEKKLSALGIRTEVIWAEGRIRENITVHTDDGKETRISFAAQPLGDDTLTRVEKYVDNALGKGDILTVTGSIPEGVPRARIIALVKAQTERGVRVIVDSRSFDLADLFEMKPYLIKPNEEEIEIYMSRRIGSLPDALSAARELAAHGISNVMISLGAKGAVLATRGGGYTVSAPGIEALSTIGAGDSSIAGFIYATERGLSPRECLVYAVAFGSAACLTRGTKPPSVEDVRLMLDLIK